MFRPTVPRRTDVIAHATDLVIWNRAVFFFIREFCWKRRSKGGGPNYSLFLAIASPTARTDEDEIRRYGTYFTYLYARNDTCYIPESRKNVQCEDRVQNDDIVRESSTNVRRSNFGFPPWLCQWGKTAPPVSAFWRFVSLAVFVLRVVLY